MLVFAGSTTWDLSDLWLYHFRTNRWQGPLAMVGDTPFPRCVPTRSSCFLLRTVCPLPCRGSRNSPHPFVCLIAWYSCRKVRTGA